MAASIANGIERENVRIKVRFRAVKGLCLEELAQRWTLVCFAESPSIKDVENKIVFDLNRELISHFNIDQQTKVQNHENPQNVSTRSSSSSSTTSPPASRLVEKNSVGVGLPLYSCDIWLNEFWLPSYENSKILREGDDITVCVKASSNPLNLTENYEDEEEKKKKRKRKPHTENLHTEVNDIDDLAEEKYCSSKKQKRTSEVQLSQEDDVENSEKRKNKKHKKHKTSTSLESSMAVEDNSLENKVSSIYQDTSKKEKCRKQKELNERPEPACHSANLLKSASLSGTKESQFPLVEGSKQQPNQCAEENRNPNSVVDKSTVSKISSSTPSNPILVKVPNHGKGQNLNPEQKSEDHFYHSKDIPKSAHELSPSEVEQNSAPDIPSDMQTLLTANTNSDGNKRRRRRKRKNKKKDLIESESNVQPHSEIERDYSLRLPQHLQPRQDNRLLFDDDDEEEDKVGCGDVVVNDDSKSDKTGDLGSPMTSTIQGPPVKVSTLKAKDNTSIDRVMLSKHRKMAVSAVFENLGKHLETNNVIGSAKKRNSSDKKDNAEYQELSKPDVTLSYKAASTDVQPKLTNFVSADDKFASLLGNTKRLPSHVPVSPVVSKHKREAVSRNSSVTNGCSSNIATPTRTNGPKFLPQYSAKAKQQTPDQSTANSVAHVPEVKAIHANFQGNPPNPPSRRELEEGLKPWPSYSSIESLPDLYQVPKAGDFLIYKTLELSEDYTPILSSYKRVLVLEVNTSSGHTQLELLMSDAEKKRQGRFELEDEPEDDIDDTETCDKSRFLATVSWSDMVGTKLLLQA